MIPFDLILGERGPAWLLGALIVAGALTVVAATLEILLERAGGPDPGAPPDWFARHGPAVFALGGVPTFVLAIAGAVALTLILGGNPERAGIPLALPILLDLAILVAIVCCGVGAPTTQHWGLGVALFGVAVSSIFPLLFIANALPFAADSSLRYPERVVFALVNGLIAAALVAAAAALISLAVSAIRTARALRHREAAEPGARLHIVRRR
jgi:hypothetical protein